VVLLPAVEVAVALLLAVEVAAVHRDLFF